MTPFTLSTRAVYAKATVNGAAIAQLEGFVRAA